jgi:hypothetical protein
VPHDQVSLAETTAVACWQVRGDAYMLNFGL